MAGLAGRDHLVRGHLVEALDVPEARRVLVAVGRKPAVEGWGLEELDLSRAGRFIKIDDQCRTSDPDIYAAGDCCSFPHGLFGGKRMRLEAWRNATDQANVATENMLGGSKPYMAVPWFWSDQYDLSLQIAGRHFEDDLVLRVGDAYEKATAFRGRNRFEVRLASRTGAFVGSSLKLR